jgi:hypothetical protein
MSKRILILSFLTTISLFADEFDLLDNETLSEKSSTVTDKDYIEFENSLEYNQDIDSVQPSAGFEELDRESIEDSFEG